MDEAEYNTGIATLA